MFIQKILILESFCLIDRCIKEKYFLKALYFQFDVLAWMETVAVNFHDETGEFLGKLKFEAGDDAVGIQWIDVDRDVKLYASHSRLIQATADLRNAHF